MSQYVDGNTKTFEADEALEQYRRVKMDADGKVTYADAGDQHDGTTEKEAYAAGEFVAVRLRTAAGTQKMVASGAITAGAKVYGADDGKVSASGYVLVGKALEAATANNDVIEVLPVEASELQTVSSVAAAGSAQGDAAALTGKYNTVSAADGTKGVILPAAQAGLEISVYNEHATNGLKIYPATGDDINDGTANAAITTEGKTLARFVGLDGATWAAIFTANT